MTTKKLNNKKGITLIALIITIIVLLILAGVSIATLIGENGILTQANKAKKETKVGSEEEIIKISLYEQYDYVDKLYNVELVKDELNKDENIEVQLTNDNNYIHIFFADSKNEYVADSKGNVKTIDNPKIYAYKYYYNDQWNIRFLVGIDTMKLSKITGYIKIGGQLIYEVDSSAYSGLSVNNETISASYFDNSYRLGTCMVSAVPEDFAGQELEVWFELKSMFSDRVYSTSHKIYNNLGEVNEFENILE